MRNDAGWLHRHHAMCCAQAGEHLEPRKNTRGKILLSMSHPGWLRFRDPYFMVYGIIPI